MNMNTFHSGNYISQGDYTSFSPTLINHSWRWNDAELNILLEQASSELGSLNAFSDLIPNIDIYIRMHIKTEANKSNKIEGTKTSIEEDLLPAEDIAPEKRDDQQEVRNYIKALNYGIKRILGDDFPLCNRLIVKFTNCSYLELEANIRLLAKYANHKIGLVVQSHQTQCMSHLALSNFQT